jgi:putative phosphoesterase
MVLEFPVLADYCVLFWEGRTVYATHGHVYNEGKLPPLGKGDVLLHGHTHVPACTDHGEYLYVNPGSVSIPKEDSPHSYVTLEGRTFTWKDMSGEPYMTFTAE